MLFKKNYKKKPVDGANKEPSAVLSKWEAFQHKLANRLQKQFELFSSSKKKYALILFCVLFGGSSAAIVVHSIISTANPVRIAGISKPMHANEYAQPALRPDSVITRQEYNHVFQFEKYLLYLRSDSAERTKYDSIIKSRPQLLDSIALFKRIYLSQNKK